MRFERGVSSGEKEDAGPDSFLLNVSRGDRYSCHGRGEGKSALLGIRQSNGGRCGKKKKEEGKEDGRRKVIT